MAEIFISVGSNINPETNVRAAIVALRAAFSNVRISPVFRSQAVGFDGDDFLNLVVAATTDLTPTAVALLLQDIENRHGRDRRQPKFSSRTLDLDLLLYDDVVLAGGGLQLPRGEIEKYAFVLAPLAAIAGDRRHPVTGQTIDAMWRCLDKSREKLQEIPFAWEESY